LDQNQIEKKEVIGTESQILNLQIPKMKEIIEQDDKEAHLKNELYEWMGLVACRATRPPPEESSTFRQIISMYSIPEPSEEGDLKLYTWTGILPCSFIKNLIDLLRKNMEKEDLPWCSLSVWGFRDSPISFFDKEHGFFKSGENDFTLLFLKDNAKTVWLFKSLGDNDHE